MQVRTVLLPSFLLPVLHAQIAALWHDERVPLCEERDRCSVFVSPYPSQLGRLRGASSFSSRHCNQPHEETVGTHPTSSTSPQPTATATISTPCAFSSAFFLMRLSLKDASPCVRWPKHPVGRCRHALARNNEKELTYACVSPLGAANQEMAQKTPTTSAPMMTLQLCRS